MVVASNGASITLHRGSLDDVGFFMSVPMLKFVSHFKGDSTWTRRKDTCKMGRVNTYNRPPPPYG